MVSATGVQDERGLLPPFFPPAVPFSFNHPSTSTRRHTVTPADSETGSGNLLSPTMRQSVARENGTRSNNSVVRMYSDVGDFLRGRLWTVHVASADAGLL